MLNELTKVVDCIALLFTRAVTTIIIIIIIIIIVITIFIFILLLFKYILTLVDPFLL